MIDHHNSALYLFQKKEIMKKRIARYTIIPSLLLLVGIMVSFVVGQYYYFDDGGNPRRQWCTRNLEVNATTDSHTTWALAGLLSIRFDPLHFLYYTGDTAAWLQTNLFEANSDMFTYYSNPNLFPQWIDTGTKNILHIDRYNSLIPFKGDTRYGRILNITPKYNPSDYTWFFAFVYANDTVQTSLSYWGKNIIDSWYQYSHLTWYYHVDQLPCIDDGIPPTDTLIVPVGWNKISYLSGITISLTENGGSALDVPYVWTGGLPGIGIRTGNQWNLTNQYGIHFDTFVLAISWNGNYKYFTGGMFSPAGTLAYSTNGMTRQFRNKNYTIVIDPTELFDYGIEKRIEISWSVYDWKWLKDTISYNFNNPRWPTLILWSPNPAAWANGLGTTMPVILWIQDEWAGVDSWTIVITLSGVNGTNYGPYIFTGNSLHLSGVAGDALLPDYYITITWEAPFPTSWHIQVSWYAKDMEGSSGSGSYIFHTAPSCADYGCCNTVYIQTGWSTLPFLYNWFILNITWWFNTSFTWTIGDYTWYIDCGLWWSSALDIYKGTEENSWIATYLSFHDLSDLIFSWDISVRATLSWQTIYLQSTNLIAFDIKAFPSNRVYQSTNNANIWVLKFYDTNKNYIWSSQPFTLNDNGTWTVLVNIDPGIYYVFFKWQSHLASYLSWVSVVSWSINTFDFTTGNNLYGTQTLDTETDDGYRYQTAWDLQNTDGEYDFVINGNDISIMLYYTFPDLSVNVLDPRNLNGDSAINASDLSVIWTNCLMQDPFAVIWGTFTRH